MLKLFRDYDYNISLHWIEKQGPFSFYGSEKYFPIYIWITGGRNIWNCIVEREMSIGVWNVPQIIIDKYPTYSILRNDWLQNHPWSRVSILTLPHSVSFRFRIRGIHALSRMLASLTVRLESLQEWENPEAFFARDHIYKYCNKKQKASSFVIYTNSANVKKKDRTHRHGSNLGHGRKTCFIDVPQSTNLAVYVAGSGRI